MPDFFNILDTPAGISGRIIQEIYVETNVGASLATARVTNDGTIPPLSEMSLFSTLDLTITPTNVLNILEFQYEINTSINALSAVEVWGIFKDAETAARKCTTAQDTNGTGILHSMVFAFRIVAGGVTEQIWHVRAGQLGVSGVVDINKRAATNILGGTLISSARVREILP